MDGMVSYGGRGWRDKRGRSILFIFATAGATAGYPGLRVWPHSCKWCRRLITSLLYGVRATDPVTFASVCLLMGGAATLASYIPVRRATNVDPVVAPRQE